MARKRAYRKRADYTKGGRVNYQRGGYGGYEGEGEDYMMNGGTPNIPQAKPQPAKPTTPSYTQADVNQAVADLNTGKITAAQLASQYGVTEDYVKQNLQAINSQAVANKATGLAKPPVDPVGATKIIQPDPDKGETFIPYNTSPYVSVDEASGRGWGASESSAAPHSGEGDSDFGWGAAARGLTEGDQDFITRRDTPETGDPKYRIGLPIIEDPNIPGLTPKPEPEPEPDPFATAVADIPADADYTQFEVNQVYDALESGAMTVEQVAAQFGATPAQVQAEWNRMKQQKAGETVTGEDPFAEGVQQATRKPLLDKATAEQLKDVDVETRTWVKDDPDTAIDERKAAGAFIKNYKRVDPDLIFDRREAVGLDTETGITADADIQQLDAYTDIDPPVGVSEEEFTEVLGVLHQAVKAKVIKPSEKAASAFIIDTLNSPQFAKDRGNREIPITEIRKLTERVNAAKFKEEDIEKSKAQVSEFEITPASFIQKVDPRERVGVHEFKEAEAQKRAMLVGEEHATSDEARIVEADSTKIDYDSFQRRDVTGVAAKEAAVKFTAEAANIPPELARTSVDAPKDVEAKLDELPVEVKVAIAAVPENALVSGQMETLLAGMETGDIPKWAKPAYDAVNQNMTQRGLDASTVGRDALFNAIIQSALPIAQSNAQALQANAAAKLDREQQAYLQEAQLDANRRINNLANRQTAESQSAQFTQQITTLRGQFNQERDNLSFQQQQQTRLQELQNRQRTAELNNQAENAIISQNLGNEQQIELAELEIRNQTEQANFTATNQERLAEMQVAADFISKNAAFDQQMKMANLSNDQQMRLANLTARNQRDSEELSAAQQAELANLNARMQTNIASANIASQMGLALLNNDQQRAVQNATMVANIDLTKFNDAQQVELANSKFMQTATLTDFNARQQGAMQDATALASLDMAAADQRTKIAISQAQNFLQRDMSNLSNEQQALILDNQLNQQRLLSNQAATNAARQFNATSENQVNQFNESLYAQMEQFNVTQANAMEQYNSAETNRVAAINASNAIDAQKFNNQIQIQVDQFNEQYDLQRDQWNAANAQAIEQSNVQWRRQANTIDTAAQNAANQENAAKAFQISAADQNFIWQELRDEAAYLRQAYENDEQRTTTLYATAISNDVGGKGATGISPIIDLIKNKVVA